MFAHFTFNFMFYNLLTSLLKYLNNVHGYNVTESGLVSTLPYIVQWICILSQAHLVAIIQKRNLVSPTVSRRIFNSISLFLPALLLGSVLYLRLWPSAICAISYRQNPLGPFLYLNRKGSTQRLYVVLYITYRYIGDIQHPYGKGLTGGKLPL